MYIYICTTTRKNEPLDDQNVAKWIHVKLNPHREGSSRAKTHGDKALLSKNPKPKIKENTSTNSSKSLKSAKKNMLFHLFPWFSLVFSITFPGSQGHALASHVASCCGALAPWRRRAVKSSAFCSPESFDSEVAC